MKRKELEKKVKFILAGVALVFLVLLVKLTFLQLVHTEQYRTLARNNYIRIVPVYAPRGEIFDRDGQKIVTNRPIYTVSINDINIKGTRYHLFLQQVGADTVRMTEMLAGVLAGDSEYCQVNGYGSEGEKPVSKLIEDRIKQKIKENKTKLEEGEPLELAVIYDPSVAESLSGQKWTNFGIKVEKKTDVLSKLVGLLYQKGIFEEASPYEVEQRVRKDVRDKKPYEPVLVAEDIPLETVVELREKQLEIPGVVVDVQPVRDYPYNELLTHVLGYVQNIKSEQYKEHKDEGYLMTDLYGQNGLELVFERYLRGVHGARQVEVDTYNRPVRDLGMKQPVPGNDLILTVDLELQLAAEKALAEGAKRARDAGYSMSQAGAAIVMDVNTGAILAMASYPSYNPGLFANGLSSAEWQELQESGALLNRAMSLYPPGSTFKMVTAAAILEKNVVDPEYKISDPGYYMLGAKRFNDWKPGGHGRVDLRRALQFSCDTYFWQFGRLAGVEAMAQYAREFGLGQSTGIDLPGEMVGAVPDPEYKYELVKTLLTRYNPDFARVRELNAQIEQVENEIKDAGDDDERVRRLEQLKKELTEERDSELEKQLKKHEWDLTWQTFDTLNMAIGQGDNWYSPLQLVSYVSAIANGGTLYKPYLVDKVVSPSGEVLEEFGEEARRQVNIKPENLKIIQEGMHLVTVPPGTAAGVFNGFKQTAAAKTGTAEVFDAEGKKKGNHALFVAYTPFEKPEVAVVVVLEYGHSGSGYAGPIARKILDAYYGADLKELFPDEGNTSSTGNEVGEEPGISAEQFAARTGDLLAVIDMMPSVSWPGWDKKAAAQPVPESERLRWYKNRLEKLRAPSPRAASGVRSEAATRVPAAPAREQDTAPVQTGTPGGETPVQGDSQPIEPFTPEPQQTGQEQQLETTQDNTSNNVEFTAPATH